MERSLWSDINKDVEGNLVKESEYYHVATTLFHEAFSHGFDHLINRKLHGKSGHTTYGKDLKGTANSNSAMYEAHRTDTRTILTEEIINQNYTLNNTNIVSNISNFLTYVYYSRIQAPASQSIFSVAIIEGCSWDESIRRVEQKHKNYNSAVKLKQNAKSNIKPLIIN